MGIGRLVQRRNVGRWLREPSTLEGLGSVAALVSGVLGVDPTIVTSIIGAIAVNAMRRVERGHT